MFKQIAFLATLGLVGCYIGEDRAETKYQTGGQVEGQDPNIETFYVATVTPGTDHNEEPKDGSQTIFLGQFDVNYKTGTANFKFKTVDKHGTVSSKCNKLTISDLSDRYNQEWIEGFEDQKDINNSSLYGLLIFENDTDNGSEMLVSISGYTDFRGTPVLHRIVRARKRVSAGMARRVIGDKIDFAEGKLYEKSHIKGGSDTNQKYMEAILGVNPDQGDNNVDYHASTGLLSDSDLTSRGRLASGEIDLLNEEFWQDAFSNCSSSSPSDDPTPN